MSSSNHNITDSHLLTNIIYHDVEQGSDEWKRIRSRLVTASQIGLLLTPTLKVSDNATSRAYLARIAIARQNGVTEPSVSTFDMARGQFLEPLARDFYSKNILTLPESLPSPGMFVREEQDWALGYSPDGIPLGDGLLEIKCPNMDNHVSTLRSWEVPPRYMPQLQAALLCSGASWIDFVSYYPSLEVFLCRVFPQKEWQDMLVTVLTAAQKEIDDVGRQLTTPKTGRFMAPMLPIRGRYE